MSEAIFHRPRAIVRIAPWAAIAASSDRLGVEVVRRLADGQAGQLGQPGAGPRGVLGMGVDPGPDGGPAERHRQQLVAGGLRAPDRLLDLAGVAAELLAEPDRRRVLEVRPAGLDDRPELLGLGGERASGARSSAGSSASSIAIAADSWSAVGMASFELWQRLTSSFGWTVRPSPSRAAARCATTSFMFVLVEVPEPVW